MNKTSKRKNTKLRGEEANWGKNARFKYGLKCLLAFPVEGPDKDLLTALHQLIVSKHIGTASKVEKAFIVVQGPGRSGAEGKGNEGVSSLRLFKGGQEGANTYKGKERGIKCSSKCLTFTPILLLTYLNNPRWRCSREVDKQ